MSSKEASYQSFWWRRLHSLMGLGIVIFLMEHLLTNSQVTYLWGDYGQGFIKSVDFIHGLPFLKVIEISILGIPIFIHALWGIKYMASGKHNSLPSDGSKPALGYICTNRAYSFQRWTAYFIFIGIIFHVVQMRFMEYPDSFSTNGNKLYSTIVSKAPEDLAQREKTMSLTKAQAKAFPEKDTFFHEQAEKMKDSDLLFVSDSFGFITMLIVKETFKDPLMVFIYTVFVLASVFHAFNGLWTFLITWGITLTPYSQKMARRICASLMVLFAALGLVAIFGTYFYG